jgi:Fe-S cluster assembly iron-binding protein IscA
MISITEAAASHLKDLIAAKNAPADHGLRIRVEKGGCAGMQYVMQIEAPAEGDAIRTDLPRLAPQSRKLDVLRLYDFPT